MYLPLKVYDVGDTAYDELIALETVYYDEVEGALAVDSPVESYYSKATPEEYTEFVCSLAGRMADTNTRLAILTEERKFIPYPDFNDDEEETGDSGLVMEEFRQRLAGLTSKS